MPDDTIAYITEVVLRVSWTTIDERNILLYYSILYHSDTHGEYDTSFWIWPADYRHYNGTILADRMMNKWMTAYMTRWNHNLSLILNNKYIEIT
jgi:hypothetical protein